MTAINSELIIDSNLLRKNISYIKSRLQNESKFMAVIKSDAYGHNLESVTKSIDDLVEGYGVVRISEAKKIVKSFLDASFIDEEKYVRRLNKINKLD